VISGQAPVKLYTPADLAEFFGISERQLLDWRRANGWPSVRVGRTIRFTQSQVDAIIARHSETTPQQDPATVTPVIPGQSKASAARKKAS
jgi:excisionase family DNA binding protein